MRKLAKDLGVDLEHVTGSGPGGLITRDDVRNFVGGGDLPAAAQELAGECRAQEFVASAQASEREVRTPIKGVRKFTAAAMVSSAFTAPHVTEFLTVDVTPAMELLARLKTSKAFAGLKLTPLTLVAKAALIALRRNPTLNSRWDEANQEIVQFNYVNLGIAAATPRGLTVPNIKDADRMTLAELSTALTGLTETARAGKTSPAELSGGTISITNIGVFGIDAGTPILNPGEAAILAMGAVRKMPWEYQDQVALQAGHDPEPVLRPPAGGRRAGLPVPGGPRSPHGRPRHGARNGLSTMTGPGPHDRCCPATAVRARAVRAAEPGARSGLPVPCSPAAAVPI